MLHTSLVVLYFFTFTVFACERNARVETEKNPELKLYSCRNVSREYFTNTHIVRLADLGVGVKELKLRATTAYMLLSAHVRPSHSLSKWWNSTSLGLVQDLGLKKKKKHHTLFFKYGSFLQQRKWQIHMSIGTKMWRVILEQQIFKTVLWIPQLSVLFNERCFIFKRETSNHNRSPLFTGWEISSPTGITVYDTTVKNRPLKNAGSVFVLWLRSSTCYFDFSREN